VDFTTIIGIMLGVCCILLGQTLEGGHVSSIVQLTAALIVVGGTLGAVITQFPIAELIRGIRQSRYIFITDDVKPEALIAKIVQLARKSRREGLLVLETEATTLKDHFFRRAVTALVDGSDATTIRKLLDNVITQERLYQEPGPKIWESAGGFAPTIGILGAVLGLIHVMENLADPEKLGAGIAVAFVATIYGVGSANLIFLPLAQKLRIKIKNEVRRKELISDGVCAIHEGMNPSMIERRLSGYLERDRALLGPGK
jgi:chemotaxis protein MotA